MTSKKLRYLKFLSQFIKFFFFIGFLLIINSCGKEVNKEDDNKSNSSGTNETNPLLGPITAEPDENGNGTIIDDPEDPNADQGNQDGDNVCSNNNLIWNHSFEEHPDQKKNSKKLYQEIPYWKNMETKSKGFELYYDKKVSKLKPQSGKAMIELDGKSGKDNDASIVQIVNTKPGKKYSLSFYYAGHNRIFFQTNIINVFWNSQKIGNIGSKKRAWKKYEMIVYADSSTSQIVFKSHKDKNGKGGFLDTIKLVEICE
jgi:hypothetical protein